MPAMEEVPLDIATETVTGPLSVAQAAPMLGAPHAPAASSGSLVMESLDDSDSAAEVVLSSQGVSHAQTSGAAPDHAGASIPFVPRALPAQIPFNSRPSAVMLQTPHATAAADISKPEAAAVPALPQDITVQGDALRTEQPNAHGEIVSSLNPDGDGARAAAALTPAEPSRAISGTADPGHREGDAQPLPLKVEGGSSAAAAAVAAAISAAAAAAEEAESAAVAGACLVSSLLGGSA